MSLTPEPIAPIVTPTIISADADAVLGTPSIVAPEGAAAVGIPAIVTPEPPATIITQSSILQGDGVGIVSIPTAAAIGDYTIIFSAVTLHAAAINSVVIGGIGLGNYLSIFPSLTNIGLDYAFEFDAGAGSGTNTLAGDTFQISIVRVGLITTITFGVDSTVLVLNEPAGEYIFDAIFTDGGGANKGLMGLSGTLSMIGFGAERLYNFNGSGSTLIDTISGQNGTLSGFTTGGFVGGSAIRNIGVPTLATPTLIPSE